MNQPKLPRSSTFDALQNLGKSRVESRLGILRGGLLLPLYRFLPYPLLMVMPFVREDTKRLIQAWKERREVGTAEVESESPELVTADALRGVGQRSPYPKYSCPEHPLACSRLQQTTAPAAGVSHCSHCGFPALLPEKAEIQGRRGRYRVGRFLGMRGLGRLYLGHEVMSRQPVVIREYSLPSQYFNPTEQCLIRDTFETIAGLKLADGREQDFRLVEPQDAIGDASLETQADRRSPERCYLITTGAVDTYPTLRSRLADAGAMSPHQVRQVLNQVLQTLESLHGQKYLLPGGQLQTGLVHGNLNLDSLVILPDAESYYERPQLLVFLRDLSLWESLFIPPPLPTQIPQVADDLKALGHIGFYLLVGGRTDPQGRRLQPHNPQIWPGTDLPLEHYLRQLLELEDPTFADAATARQALLRLPSLPEDRQTHLLPVPPQVAAPSRRLPLWGWLLLLGGLGLLGALLLGWWWSRRQAIARPPHLCCIAEVPAVPPGQFTYTAERQGTWYPLWHSKNLVAQNKTLEQVLETQQPDLDLQLLPMATRQEVVAQVLQDAAEFAIVPLTDDRPPELTAVPVAYDGLVAFVAFSYVQRDRGLPQHLQGELSLAQLRQLYTGEIRNWQALGGPDLPVQLYLPDQPDLIRVFEQRVLQTPDAIQTFRRLWNLETSNTTTNPSPFITRLNSETFTGKTLPPPEMMRQILKDFERPPQVGSIGFASLSHISGQCSIYPLAIATDHTPAVQPLYQSDGTPISPAIDLCGDKGNYAPKQILFAEQTYPLAYPLAVLYRLDNSREAIGPAFVQMMMTDEGQRLLGKIGLVPLVELPY